MDKPVPGPARYQSVSDTLKVMDSGRWRAPAAQGPVRATLRLPGSQSITNRALLLAAISDAPSLMHGALKARDSSLAIAALRALGCSFDERGTDLAVSPGSLAVGDHRGYPGHARGGRHPGIDNAQHAVAAVGGDLRGARARTGDIEDGGSRAKVRQPAGQLGEGDGGVETRVDRGRTGVLPGAGDYTHGGCSWPGAGWRGAPRMLPFPGLGVPSLKPELQRRLQC